LNELLISGSQSSCRKT